MVQPSAIRCNFVSQSSEFCSHYTLYCSQRVFIVVVYFVMSQSGDFWIHPRTRLNFPSVSFPHVIVKTDLKWTNITISSAWCHWNTMQIPPSNPGWGSRYSFQVFCFSTSLHVKSVLIPKQTSSLCFPIHQTCSHLTITSTMLLHRNIHKYRSVFS